MSKIKDLFIVGAGFSHYAGLPLTANFTQELLNIRDYNPNGPSGLIVSFLRSFVNDAFDHQESAAAKYWPHLEDIFTCVDLSANTGHHLGTQYSPSDLRTVRRALIVRTIRMLRQTYTRAKKERDNKWELLEKFFSRVDPTRSAFLSMNWDTVIEEGLQSTQNIKNFDYGCEARRAAFRYSKIQFTKCPSGPNVLVLKPHGSANWLYCDACRQLFWFEPAISTSRIASHLFTERDWTVVDRHIFGIPPKTTSNYRCPKCRARALGTRFATFSYRKALDFPMYERSWLAAEGLLQQAGTWIFIGYSLPAADYEFKHLLKKVQLSRRTPPKLILVTGGIGAESTLASYRKFFGPVIRSSNKSYFGAGLNNETITQLSDMGALRDS